jgi:hypothetical protein
MTEDTWSYVLADMTLHQGYVLHRLNRHVTDQIIAWQLIADAEDQLERWHDASVDGRNFESSLQYANVHWRKALFMLRGGDLSRAERFVARMYDVDVFNAIRYMSGRRLLGKALVLEARARQSVQEMHRVLGPSRAGNREEFKGVFELGELALQDAYANYEYDIVGDILMLLGRAAEGCGNPAARDYYHAASEHLQNWVGDPANAAKNGMA